MEKSNALDVLVENYLDNHPIGETDSGFDIFNFVCKDDEQRRLVREEIEDYVNSAFRSGFYTAISFVTGGVK